MPQFTEFPLLPKGEFKTAIDALILLCRKMPKEGEPLKEFRARLKAAGMWSRERAPALHRFLRVAQADPVVPSPLVRAIADTPDATAARAVLADRLWTVNPVLFKCAIERIKERVHSPNELLKYLDSFAYPGARLTGPQVTAWIQFAQGLEIFRPVGIRLGLDKLGEKFVDRAEALDLDEYFEEDRDEPEAQAAAGAVAETPPAPAAPVEAAPPEPEPAAAEPILAPVASPMAQAPRAPNSPRPAPAPPVRRSASQHPSPLGRDRAVPPARFATNDRFADAVLAETRARIDAWSGELSLPEVTSSAAAFGLDAESWNEDAERILFRLAVVATWVLRLGQSAAEAAWAHLEPSGVVDALYDGSAPDIAPAEVDPQALLWLSLLARRFAELPDLAAELDRQSTAEDVFRTLDAALGRGLLGLELFWMLRELEAAGIVKRPGLSAFTALPDRAARDTLFRLGYLRTPYAPDGTALAIASAAVREAAGDAPDAEARLHAFGDAAGCAYDCAQRRRCEYACRERSGG